MRYGHFDLEAKEYVIDRPDTPAPWCNYLGSPEYGAIISGNAEGYSFVKSGAKGRITRFRFNSSMSLPGRFIYIRDNDSKDYWSATWKPVQKDFDKYKCSMRHGTAYSVATAEYAEIKSKVTYYVPLGKTYEVWDARVTNTGSSKRDISVFSCVEFTNEDNYEQDQVNLQYTEFISRTELLGNKLIQHINEFTAKDPNGGKGHQQRFIGLAGEKVTDACGSLDDFIGRSRTFANPEAVERGECGMKMNYNLNSCGTLQSRVTIEPGEIKRFTFVMGSKTAEEADVILKSYEDASVSEKEVEALKTYWHGELSHFSVKTPSDEFNNMINVWNAYQCFITFTWSRAASLLYCGQRNGYGYRDTVQDIQGVIHQDPEMALEKIRFMLSAQVDNGAGLPLVKFNHNAGHENTPDDPAYVKETGHPSYRADDALWLFPTVYKYIAETGNKAFLDEKIVYANGGEDTVYDHLKRAVKFSMDHSGRHGMPAGLHADWNDCLRLGAAGESTFVAFQLYYALNMMKEIAASKGDNEYAAFMEESRKKLHKILTKCWDGDRFIRGIREDNEIVGAAGDLEANMWLNPQSWAVISGVADDEQADIAMESVHRLLNTPYGAKLLTPPYRYHSFPGALMQVFNPGTKENGGIFSQSQGWLILAEALRGKGDRAFEYFKESAPAAMNDDADRRLIEPYVHGQFTESDDTPVPGRAHVHWLTGTASTVMVGCVEGICGIRPNFDGIRISPAICSKWDGMEIEKDFRGSHLSIKIKNPEHVESGVNRIILNGEIIEGDFIPADKLAKDNKIEITLCR